MNSSNPQDVPNAQPVRHGVVAVVWRQQRFLVIRRSAHVAAPGQLCFPGGGIEQGETEPQALAREMQEELACDVRPLRRLWRSRTAWHVELAWWQVALSPPATWTLNQAEVSDAFWLTPDQLGQCLDLLSSNLEFLAAWRRGEFTLDEVS